jgi:dihydrofolate reductase
MGTLTIATFMTLDGVMQAPGGPDEDRDGGFEHGGWSFPYFSEDMGDVINDAFAKAEAILLGRRTYEIFAASWPNFPDKDDRWRRGSTPCPNTWSRPRSRKPTGSPPRSCAATSRPR